MIRKFELCSLRLVGFGSARALTNASDDGDTDEDVIGGPRYFA